jgi:hypothetical protein
MLILKQYNKLNKKDKKSYFNLCNEFKNLFERFLRDTKPYLDHLKKSTDYESDNDFNFIREEFLASWSKNMDFRELDSFSKINESFINIFSIILDIYTIGRLLKPYVKNSIIYVGVQHSTNIIKELTNNFGFEIIENSRDLDYPKWNEIYETKNYVNITNLKPFWK